jgi:hypothetical protein
MEIKDVRNNLLDGMDVPYPPTEIKFIDIRLDEIAEMENMSLEELDYYCWLNADEMFQCIYNYKEFKKENFKL